MVVNGGGRTSRSDRRFCRRDCPVNHKGISLARRDQPPAQGLASHTGVNLAQGTVLFSYTQGQPVEGTVLFAKPERGGLSEDWLEGIERGGRGGEKIGRGNLRDREDWWKADLDFSILRIVVALILLRVLLRRPHSLQHEYRASCTVASGRPGVLVTAPLVPA